MIVEWVPDEGRGKEAPPVGSHMFWTKMGGEGPDSFPLPHRKTSCTFLSGRVHFKSRQLDKGNFCLVQYRSQTED